MHLVSKTLIIATLFIFTSQSRAEDLLCNVSLFTTSGKILDSRLHDQSKHRSSTFFTFSITSNKDSSLYIHQNRCITGKDLKDRRLKGSLCLLVTSGAKTLQEPSITSNDPYFMDNAEVVTFNVFHSTRSTSSINDKIHLQASTEATTPISSYRSTFQGAGGGLGSLTLTCTKK
jgi:hypothetical protein